MRLASVACCRPLEQFAGGDPFLNLLEWIEALADGRDKERARDAITSAETWFYARWGTLHHRAEELTDAERLEEEAEDAIICAGAEYRDREWHYTRKNYPYPCFVADHVTAAFDLLGQLEVGERHIVRVVHDIFGPLPFRGVAVAPGWLTSDVTGLAKVIYDAKAFDRMPVLADALQDAGCTNDELLAHCRARDWEHVRGCWVLDLLLGRPWREAG
jgi:hypothetical protein